MTSCCFYLLKEFYAEVEDPIDFSKIMLKFRGSKYQDPFDFERDVTQMFDDYKKFFKDPQSEVASATAQSVVTPAHRKLQV